MYHLACTHARTPTLIILTELEILPIIPAVI